jgi:hypothetical protein
MPATRLRSASTCALLTLALATAAEAVVARIYPLGQVIQGSDWIASGTAGKPDPARGRISLTLQGLKGTPPAAPLRLSLSGPSGKQLQDRVAAGQSFVLFGSEAAGGTLFGFTNGTWLKARRAGAGWTVASLHPEMARTWKGTSTDLTRLVREILDGKTPPPAPDPKVKPSLGPPVKR